MAASTVKAWSPSKQTTNRIHSLASTARKAAKAERTAWLNLCTALVAVQEDYRSHDLTMASFWEYAVKETGFASSTLQDGVKYAATLPSCGEGAADLDKSWITTVAKADPEDRPSILEQVQAMPEGTTAKDRKQLLSDLADASVARNNPDKIKAKQTRAAKTATDKIDAAVDTMPTQLRNTIKTLSGRDGLNLLRLVADYTLQHGYDSDGKTPIVTKAMVRVYGETHPKPAKAKPEAPKPEQVPVAA